MNSTQLPSPAAGSARSLDRPRDCRPQRLPLRGWLFGLVGSWSVVWLLGPLLLDSILVRSFDPDLGVNTLRPGDIVRWRSEGWASTRIGPHGLPGWQPPPAHDHQPITRLAVWGDSQVEGVCVDDSDKIHAQVIRIAAQRDARPWDCLPLGRSAADARHWRQLLNQADALWAPSRHVWLVTELADLTIAVTADQPPDHYPASPDWVIMARRWRGEAILAASKRILRDPNSGQLRRLDFHLGPRPAVAGPSPPTPAILSATADWVAAAAGETGGRLTLIYAPDTPRIGDGVLMEHPDDGAFDQLAALLDQRQVPLIDLRPTFREHWRRTGRFPRGFHNGLPSFGHLNAEGNQLVAQAIVDAAAPQP